MTKQQFDKILKPLIDIIDDIELDLIKDILMRIDKYNDVKGTLEWYTEKLTEFGLLKKDNLKVFKNNKSKLKEVIENIAKECGYNISSLEKFRNYYEKGLINTNPLDIYNSVAINRLIKDAINDTDDIMSLIETKAIEGANKAYKDILNKAYIETSSGTYTYTQAIMRACDDMIKNGIDTVHYRNGKSISIESVVRRDVVTRMNKLVGDVEIENAKELETNLMYVSQHLGARTRTKYTKNDYEAHDEWQGKVYMINGSSDKYPNLVEKTGYGEMLGLKGINCYHEMEPIFEWEEIPKELDIEESKKQYQIFRQQRAYEKRIRQLKRKKQVAIIMGDKDTLIKVNSKLSSINKEFNNFVESNNLRRDYTREYIARK